VFKRVDAHQLAELEEVRDAARFLEALVEVVAGAGELKTFLASILAEGADFADAFLQTFGVRDMPQSSHMIFAELAVEESTVALAFDGEPSFATPCSVAASAACAAGSESFTGFGFTLAR